jgi:hypothetical protein
LIALRSHILCKDGIIIIRKVKPSKHLSWARHGFHQHSLKNLQEVMPLLAPSTDEKQSYREVMLPKFMEGTSGTGAGSPTHSFSP